jgi:signal transduction histidine kinase
VSSAPRRSFEFEPLSSLPLEPDHPTEVRPKLLIAEDNRELATYIERLLQPTAEIRLVGNGEDALSLARHWLPDLILSDVMMPGRDGFSLCRELKASSRTAQIPIILLTALTHRDALLKGWEAGADEYLYKPFHPRELTTRVNSLLKIVRYRQKAEAQRLRIEELERFTHIASHDLKEPLRNIQVFSQLIERNYRPKLDENGSVYLGYVVDNARRMQNLLNDLISYAMAGKDPAPPVPVQLDRTLEEIKLSLQLGIEETGAQISLGGVMEVRAERAPLALVLQNLIGNALKFRKRDVPPRIHVEVSAHPEEWEFSVSDNGIGIEPEYQETVFLMFKRLHTVEAYPGSGMGLAICRRLVEGQGGRIWVTSNYGEGSIFRFCLPKQRASHGFCRAFEQAPQPMPNGG